MAEASSVNDPDVSVCKNDKIVMQDNGRIERVPYTTVPGIYANNVSGDIATYFKDRLTGKKLNMGRSFGDYEYEFICDIPSVCCLTYDKLASSTTIIGSDGYFNCTTLSNLEMELKLAADQQICDNSVDFVENTFGCKYADNMTVIAICSI